MKRSVIVFLCLCCVFAGTDALGTMVFMNRPDAAIRFAQLPEGAVFPEGIAVDPVSGDVFVSTSDFTFSSGEANKVLRYARNGRLEAVLDVSPSPLLGLAYCNGYVYIANTEALVGATSKIQRVAADFDSSSLVEDVAEVPEIFAPGDRTVANPDGSTDTVVFGSNGVALPNAIAVDDSATPPILYFTDSFQGAVFKVEDFENCQAPCVASVMVHDPLLATANHSIGIGANGIAIDKSARRLYVANLGDDRIVTVDLDDGTAEVFAEDLPRPDGVMLDDNGRLWVCSVYHNEILVLDPDARIVARLGSFKGIDRHGMALGLLGPASCVANGNWLYVTNFVYPVVPSYVDFEDISIFSISRIRIPHALR